MSAEPVKTENFVDPKVAVAPPITDPHQELNKPEIPEPRVPPKPLPQAEMEPSLVRQAQHLLSQYVKQGFRVTLLEAFDQFSRRFRGVPLLRFSKLAENLHIGGQYSPKGWHKLSRQRGVDAVVNMRAEFNENDHGFGPDIENYCYLPTPDGFAPSIKDVHVGVGFIRQQIEQGDTVYVHCWEGVGRAPTMVASYLVSTGMTPSEAWGKIKALRPFIRPSPAQLWVVDQFAYEWGQAEQPALSEQVATAQPT